MKPKLGCVTDGLEDHLIRPFQLRCESHLLCGWSPKTAQKHLHCHCELNDIVHLPRRPEAAPHHSGDLLLWLLLLLSTCPGGPEAAPHHSGDLCPLPGVHRGRRAAQRYAVQVHATSKVPRQPAGACVLAFLIEWMLS